MGREIRRVPPNWQHPRNEQGRYQPMYDETFDNALDEWVKNYHLWKKGSHPDQQEYPYWEWAGKPPDPDYYRPEFDQEPTYYQVYETISEGVPVTPPFATKEELVNYLVKYGDFWDQKRGDGGWARENAERFVSSEWAPSFMVFRSSEETVIKAPRDGA